MRMSVGTNGLFLKLGFYVYSALMQQAEKEAPAVGITPWPQGLKAV